jgi:4-nitrophenyl phosphatase/NagD protein
MKTVLVDFKRRWDSQHYPRGLVDLVVGHVDDLLKYI